MNNLEYLNSISSPSSTAPAPPVSSLFDQKPVRIGIIALIVLALFALIFMLFSNNSSPSEPPELGNLKNLYSRLLNLNSELSTYSKQVKSASLRSTGGSLSAIITNSTFSLSSLLTSDYGLNPEEITPSAELASEFESSHSSLEAARLNGLLDRAYANELEYSVSVILAIEGSILEKSENESIKSTLKDSASSLEIIKSDLSNYLKNSK